MNLKTVFVFFFFAMFGSTNLYFKGMRITYTCYVGIYAKCVCVYAIYYANEHQILVFTTTNSAIYVTNIIVYVFVSMACLPCVVDFDLSSLLPAI